MWRPLYVIHVDRRSRIYIERYFRRKFFSTVNRRRICRFGKKEPSKGDPAIGITIVRERMSAALIARRWLSGREVLANLSAKSLCASRSPPGKKHSEQSPGRKPRSLHHEQDARNNTFSRGEKREGICNPAAVTMKNGRVSRCEGTVSVRGCRLRRRPSDEIQGRGSVND